MATKRAVRVGSQRQQVLELLACLLSLLLSLHLPSPLSPCPNQFDIIGHTTVLSILLSVTLPVLVINIKCPLDPARLFSHVLLRTLILHTWCAFFTFGFLIYKNGWSIFAT